MGDAIGAIGGSVFGAKGARDATGALVDAGEDALALQREQRDQARSDLAPWKNVGSSALFRLSDLLGLSAGYDQNADQLRTSVEPYYASTKDAANAPLYYNPYTGETNKAGGPGFIQLNQTRTVQAPGVGEWDRDAYGNVINSDFENLKSARTAREGSADFGYLGRNFSMEDFKVDPGYQFRLDEGMKALERSQAARGGLLSGAATKAAINYNSNMGAQEYGAAFNRDMAQKQNIYNMLSGTAGFGERAVNTGINVGQNYADQSGDLLTQIGNAKAAGEIAQANAWSTGLNSLGGMF